METVILQRGGGGYPVELERTHRPPPHIYCRGDLGSLMERPRVAIVGSRLITPYGRQVTRQFATELAKQGIVIVSGLALGVDAQAHEGALSVGGLTLAVLPSPVGAPVPATNRRLAQRILDGGGALVSQYPPGNPSHKGNFVERNELVAALSDAVLVTEARAKSGSLHTVDFALEMGITVLAVPGNITSPMSAGTNTLAQTRAHLVTSVRDVMECVGMQLPTKRVSGDTPAEQCILDLLAHGPTEGEVLLNKSGLAVNVFNQSLTMLEITAKIVPLGANMWGLA